MAEEENTEEALSQEEIDDLLGFDDNAGLASTGIQSLLDRSMQTYERLPMLEVVFDRFIRSSSTSLRNFTNENVDVNIESIASMRFEDYLNSVPLPALLAVFNAVEWENFGIVTIDSSLTYSMVDVLLGGGHSSKPIRIDGRPFTSIEQDIVKTLTKVMLDDMSSAFNPLTPATFRLERLETNPSFATITMPSNPVILVSLRVEMDDRGGKAEIMLPYITLEPIKHLLLQMFAGESFGSETSWESHLNKEVMNTEISLEAVLKTKKLNLEQLAALKVGQTIVMDNTSNDEIDLKCKGTRMLSGKMGSSGNNIAIRVGTIYEKGIKKVL